MESYKEIFINELLTNYKKFDWKKDKFGVFRTLLGKNCEYELSVGLDEFGTVVKVNKSTTHLSETILEQTDDRVKGLYDKIKTLYIDLQGSSFWEDVVDKLQYNIK